MRPIPKALRDEMQADPYMRLCCIPGCSRPASWHHCWTYAGDQINEKWAIMPVCPGHHQVGREALHKSRKTKEFVQYLSLLRATPEDLAKYPRKNWNQLINYLKYQNGKEKTSSQEG